MRSILAAALAVLVAAGAGLAARSASAPAPAPRNVSPPRIRGGAVEYQVLRATPGGWVGARSFAYQWQRCTAYTGGVSIDGPIAWWRMGAGSGRKLLDSSAFENDGTLPPGVRFSAGPLVEAGDKAAVFPGTGAATVPRSETLDALGGFLTLELWLKPRVGSKRAPLIVEAAGDGSTIEGGYPGVLFGLILENPHVLTFRLRLQVHPYDDEGTEFPPEPIRDVVVRAPLEARQDGWIHVLATHTVDDGNGGTSGGEMKVYVNGRLAAEREATGVVPAASGARLTIGGFPGGPFYSGQLDEVAAYLYPLGPKRASGHFVWAHRGCVDVKDADARSYVLSEVDFRSRMRLRVTATNASGRTTATSAQTVVIGPEPPTSDESGPGPTYVPGPPPDLPDPDLVGPS